MIKEQLAKLGGLVGGARGFRRQADRMRDDRRFAAAAELYERYLSLRPDDFGIWVQRGNCLKDSGALGEAKLAYERAIGLRPNDPDVHLQMGHLMKLWGNREAAVHAYRQSQTLDPMGGLAAGELRGLGVGARIAPPVVEPKFEAKAAQAMPAQAKLRISTPAGPSIFDAPELKGRAAQVLDITDLLTFLDDNTRVTGIQRVQCSIVNEIVADASETDCDGVVIAYYDEVDRAIYAVSPTRVRALIQVVGSTDVTLSEVRQQLQNVYASRRSATLRASDSYIVLGAYWLIDDYASILLQLKRAGVCIGVYIYDLIPITYPQFVHELSRRAVLEKFKDVIQLVDFVLTISEFVAKEVDSVLSSELNRNIPVLAVPLSHELPEIRDEDETDEDFAESLPREYVLCVCTLEGRKNHQLLLNAWTALKRKHGRRVPHLILVGKWGWRGEEFRDQLHAQRNVDGKIIVLGSVSDAHLKHLYEHCLFTVFPSFAEGWGLPVGESLAYGKPCIASDATSIPEVGGDFCRYINPYDPMSATAEIGRAFLDRAELEAWTNRVARDFKIRTWADVAADLLRKARQVEALAREAPRRPAVTLEAGGLYQLTRPGIYGGDTRSWPSQAVKFVCAAGWRPFEDWGCWSRLPTAMIEFGAALPPRTKVQLFLKLSLPPPLMTGVITVRDWAHKSSVVFIPQGPPIWAKIETETDARGDVSVRLERLEHVTHLNPNRELYVGVGGLAYFAADDISQRMNVLEELFLSSNAPAG